MRLWSLHPRHLDRQGLLALWREGLLARKVLAGQTRGYRHHPQLDRFRQLDAPVLALDRYLGAVVAEAARRGYRFDATKIKTVPVAPVLTVTTGQMAYEWEHLRRKLSTRAPTLLLTLPPEPDPHPCFAIAAGPVADWERFPAGAAGRVTNCPT